MNYLKIKTGVKALAFSAFLFFTANAAQAQTTTDSSSVNKNQSQPSMEMSTTPGQTQTTSTTPNQTTPGDSTGTGAGTGAGTATGTGSSADEASAAVITDDDITKYAAINDSINMMKQEVTDKIVSMIKEEGLEAKVYNELSRTEKNPSARKMKVSAADEAKYKRIKEKTAELQTELNKKASDLVMNSGLPASKYNEIQRGVATDPIMKDRVSKASNSGSENKK